MKRYERKNFTSSLPGVGGNGFFVFLAAGMKPERAHAAQESGMEEYTLPASGVCENGMTWIPATGEHSYTVEKIVTEATCTANAVKGYFCATCGTEDESKRVEVPDTAGHVFEGDTC